MNPNSDRRPRRNDTPPEEKQFDERVISIDRVARVVKGGRRFRFRALVVVGDRKNKVGIGVAKGADVTAAVAKATEDAKKHFITVITYKGTIPHESYAKVGGAKIMIKPASVGTGLIAGGTVRTVLEVAGVRNVLSKSLGSSNKVNTAYATVAALADLVPAKKWVTNSLGKSTENRALSIETENSKTKIEDKAPKAVSEVKASKTEKADKAPKAEADKKSTTTAPKSVKAPVDAKVKGEK